MTTANLFPTGEFRTAQPKANATELLGEPRVLKADRQQLRFVSEHLDSLLPLDHRARAIWMFVNRLDLSSFYRAIGARGSTAGRPAIDPKILLTLWLYATSEGVAHARQLARLCESHVVYRWICGGVSVNYHTLSDFRVGHREALDELLTQVLAVLMREGVVTLKRIAQDGTRVRASAGTSSFRREESLKRCLQKARDQVEYLKREAEKQDSIRSARQRSVEERAAREMEERVSRALDELPKARVSKKKESKEKKRQRAENARVSTTDPEARVMKMADGGFRPGYNMQFAADIESRVVVGVLVSNVGSDQEQMEPMLDEIRRRTARQPEEYLVDGGYTKLEAISNVSAQGTTVYAPVPEPRTLGIDRYEPKDGDDPAVAKWRQRMGTQEAKEIYKERAATIETVNGDLKAHRGLGKLPVRGLKKVLNIGLWMALTYNLLTWMRLDAGLC